MFSYSKCKPNHRGDASFVHPSPLRIGKFYVPRIFGTSNDNPSLVPRIFGTSNDNPSLVPRIFRTSNENPNLVPRIFRTSNGIQIQYLKFFIQLARKKLGRILPRFFAPTAIKIGQKKSLGGSPMHKLSFAILVSPIQSVVLEGELFENIWRKLQRSIWHKY